MLTAHCLWLAHLLQNKLNSFFHFGGPIIFHRITQDHHPIRSLLPSIKSQTHLSFSPPTFPQFTTCLKCVAFLTFQFWWKKNNDLEPQSTSLSTDSAWSASISTYFCWRYQWKQWCTAQCQMKIQTSIVLWHYTRGNNESIQFSKISNPKYCFEWTFQFCIFYIKSTLPSCGHFSFCCVLCYWFFSSMPKCFFPW